MGSACRCVGVLCAVILCGRWVNYLGGGGMCAETVEKRGGGAREVDNSGVGECWRGCWLEELLMRVSLGLLGDVVLETLGRDLSPVSWLVEPE